MDVFVESSFFRSHAAAMLRRLRSAPQLPFARQAGGVPRVSHQVCERLLALFQMAEPPVVAPVVLAGHDLDPRRCADRLGIAVREAHTFPSKPLEDRSFVAGPAVRRNTLVAHVVG